MLPLAKAWDLISAAPAQAAGLSDRGVLAQGHRADIILVDDELPLRPRIVAVIAAGRLVHLTEANRLTRCIDWRGARRLQRSERGSMLRDMTDFPRYAIYYAAAAGSDLDRFGAQLLGYDALTGEDLPFPDGVLQTVPDWRDLTRDPRKYGFHATLKAPMALAPGKTEAELLAACAGVRRHAAADPGDPPGRRFHQRLRRGGAGRARRPSWSGSPPIACATSIASARRSRREDRARRNPSALTPRQRDYLDRWGYPYVMEEFRFHMTLTGRLDAQRREPILAMLRERFAVLGLATAGDRPDRGVSPGRRGFPVSDRAPVRPDAVSGRNSIDRD